jgi:hypothetical protein
MNYLHISVYVSQNNSSVFRPKLLRPMGFYLLPFVLQVHPADYDFVTLIKYCEVYIF